MPLALLCASSLLNFQDPLPVAEVGTLLSIPFHVDRGAFRADYIQVAFAKEGDTAEVVLLNSTGETAGSVQMKVHRYASNPVFGMLRPNQPVAEIRIPADGDYALSVRVRDAEVSRVAFSARLEKSGDAFQPRNYWRLTGPWDKLAMVTKRTNTEGQPLRFWFWTCMAQSGGKSAPVSVKFKVGGEVVAKENSILQVNQEHWSRYYTDLRIDKNNMLFAGGLAGRSGEGSAEVTVGGKLVATYKFKVSDGKIVALPESAIDFAPRGKALMAKLIDPLDRSFRVLEAYWMRAE